MKTQSTEKYAEHKKYLDENVQVHIKPLMVEILKQRPADVLGFMVDWCQARRVKLDPSRKPLTEKKSVTLGNEQKHKISSQQKTKPVPETPESSVNDADSAEEDNEKQMAWINKRKSQQKKKMAISAEVYGKSNFDDFEARVVPKTPEEMAKIRKILGNNFMFNSLDEKGQEIVMNAMEIKEYAAGDNVIRQGDDGNELFIVDTGLLKCTQKRANVEEEVFLKNYEPGGLFGELALMYNVPRAASIVAVEPSRLFALDRMTFNCIVKGSVIKMRERFEQFLNKIDILKDLDDQEKAKICDCLITERFQKGDLVIKEGDQGEKFYLLQEGSAEAFKTDSHGKETKVYEYKENDYFGELALLNSNMRKASIRVTSDKLVVASIDKESFKRLLGPIEGILERNQERYQKYADQKEV
jgi:cAMP-dependent protein kinase regulator